MGQLEHIKEAVERVMENCKCTMRQSVLGDGCPVCQPETWKSMKQWWMEECRQEYRDDIALEMRHNIMIDVDAFPEDWDMLAEYFTHL